jgi:hypothetical protein
LAGGIFFFYGLAIIQKAKFKKRYNIGNPETEPSIERSRKKRDSKIALATRRIFDRFVSFCVPEKKAYTTTPSAVKLFA